VRSGPLPLTKGSVLPPATAKHHPDLAPRLRDCRWGRGSEARTDCGKTPPSPAQCRHQRRPEPRARCSSKAGACRGRLRHQLVTRNARRDGYLAPRHQHRARGDREALKGPQALTLWLLALRFQCLTDSLFKLLGVCAPVHGRGVLATVRTTSASLPAIVSKQLDPSRNRWQSATTRSVDSPGEGSGAISQSL
jgi:hypothetical protein